MSSSTRLEPTGPSAGRRGGRRELVCLLDEDPQLAVGIARDELAVARRHAIASVMEIRSPRWDISALDGAAQDGWLGLFALEGLLLRQVGVGRRRACELLGPGDLIRPWDTDGEYGPLPITVEWIVLRPTRMAILDTAFVRRIARWPSITSRIVSRVAQRARYLALTQAVTHLPRASARLLILFWLLGERWGKVTPQGVSVTLPLTHEVLGMLVGARRPTVTLALQRLAQSGFLTRVRTDQWLLTKRAISCLDHPESLELVDSED